MLLLAVLVASVVSAFSAGSAMAHAELALAKPAPGTGLPQAPAAVVLKFSEPLNISISRIRVLDATGLDVGMGSTETVGGDPTAMQRRLGLLPVGQYTVAWTTVSSLDGHSLHGSYRFGVGTSAAPDEQVRDSPIDSEGLLGLVGRFIALLGLGLWLGAGFLGNRVARAGLPRRTVAALWRVAPALALAGMTLTVVSSSLVATDSLAGVPGVFASGSGQLRALVIVASLVGLILGPRLRLVGLVVAMVAIVGEAASGHAATSPSPILATALWAAHLGAVGVWLFAILAALLSWPRLREMLAVVSTPAIVAAVVVGLSGVASAVFVLSDIDQLFSTDYGRLLVGKGFAFVLMASFGLIHYFLRRNPAGSPWALRFPVRYEASAGLFAVGLAVILVGFPNPPRETEAGEQLALVDPVLEQLGNRDALSLASASGPFVMGLTILPPEPGPVEFRLQVLGLEAGDAPRDARISASGPDTFETSLEPCGLGCFAGHGSLAAGLWNIEASVTTNRDVAAMTVQMPMPSLDGAAELGRAISAMESLGSARLIERLQGSLAGETYLSDYQFQSPDRMRITTARSDRVVIGARDFQREPDGTWKEVEWPGSPFTWPGSYYRDFWTNAAAVRITGTEIVDHVPSRIVTFVRPEIPAWFRIWVGMDDGLVRRMEMRAEGHLMDHEWAPNAQVSIEPPI